MVMSATEIIAEIKKLPREEQQKIAAYINAIAPQRESEPVSEARYATDGEFNEAVERVLNERAELLRKLAQ